MTRPERTLIDSAAVVPEPAASGYLESALGAGLTTVDRVWSYLSRYGGPGRRGSGMLRRILADHPGARPTESGLEDRAVAVLRRSGAPVPVRQYPFGPYRLDLAYPESGVAVEVDSARWHSDSASYRRDRQKWNLLTANGWTLLIVTEFDLHERPAGVAADLSALLARPPRHHSLIPRLSVA